MLRYRSAVLLFLGWGPFADASDTLEAFAAKCDQAIGVTVPDFNCDCGTKVPTTHHDGGKCDRPNVLNKACDPDSRFQVLASTDFAYVVAHCRKQGMALGECDEPNAPGQYGDIAVIQHNKVNGATCFYQGALAGLSHNGNVKAPSKGVGDPPFWMTPSAIARSSFPCAGCHDNGPIIRSPYLTQLAKIQGNPNVLPGTGETDFNLHQPYAFVGEDFASWKAYKVEVSGNPCTSCHRMGVSNLKVNGETNGTASFFATFATAPEQPSKHKHTMDAPIWMRPGQIVYDPDVFAWAETIRKCAAKFVIGGPLPNSPECRITEYAGKYTGGPWVKRLADWFWALF